MKTQDYKEAARKLNHFVAAMRFCKSYEGQPVGDLATRRRLAIEWITYAFNGKVPFERKRKPVVKIQATDNMTIFINRLKRKNGFTSS